MIDDECVSLLELYSLTAEQDTVDAERFGFDVAVHAAQAIRRSQMHDALMARAETDGLTGLLNHRAIVETLEAEVMRATRLGRPCGVVIIDLDDFKRINDRHGHLAGDHVLQTVARVLRSVVRGVDRVGRYGGDEFLVLLPEADTVNIEVVADRIGEVITSTHLTFGGRSLDIDLSLGVATCPADEITSQELVAAADARMYAIKQSRRTGTDIASTHDGGRRITSSLQAFPGRPAAP